MLTPPAARPCVAECTANSSRTIERSRQPPILEVATELFSLIAAHLGVAELATLVCTSKKMQCVQGNTLEAHLQRAWEERAAGLAVYGGQLKELLSSLTDSHGVVWATKSSFNRVFEASDYGIFRREEYAGGKAGAAGERLKAYLQTTPPGLVDPRMTTPVEVFAALSPEEQEQSATAFNARVGQALDATLDPGSWDDQDRKQLDSELQWAKQRVEGLAEQGLWPYTVEGGHEDPAQRSEDFGFLLENTAAEIDRAAIARGYRGMILDEYARDGVTPEMLEMMACGPKRMFDLHGGSSSSPAFLCHVHWWFEEAYEGYYS